MASERRSTPSTSSTRTGLFRTGVHYAESVELLYEDGWNATGEVREQAEKVGVEFEELVVRGTPDRAIVTTAEEIGADLIVLGSEGESRMEHALIGSVSEEVLRRANRTVPVVGGHPEEGKSGQGETQDESGGGDGEPLLGADAASRPTGEVPERPGTSAEEESGSEEQVSVVPYVGRTLG